MPYYLYRQYDAVLPVQTVRCLIACTDSTMPYCPYRLYNALSPVHSTMPYRLFTADVLLPTPASKKPFPCSEEGRGRDAIGRVERCIKLYGGHFPY
ncbi:hypothetical protein TNCT_668071 [Trichonephila clavata]|uniref:Uncharacterized protein n=1 Tax=Trichonephila clavata TaxID=2740835 RepID=A0A8X6IRP4_TRICU|nr:hypothetical protein TNCT_668071 [Trichonephila clavata]